MKGLLHLALLGSVVSLTARAGTIVLTFEGLQNNEEVLNYYNGGLGSEGSGPGPNYGITFDSDALALINDQNGGTGNFAGNPSGDTTLYFLSGSATMNVAAGFTTGFSFYYSAIHDAGSITVWIGLNDTGTLLQTITLPVTSSEVGTNPACTQTDEPYCPFFALGVTFSGTAESVDFGGTVNQIGFDNITLGSATAGGSTPEPVTFTLLGLGLASFAVISRRKRRHP
jgi:hypothetical protein